MIRDQAAEMPDRRVPVLKPGEATRGANFHDFGYKIRIAA